MLKICYAESGLSLEQFDQPLDMWVVNNTLLSLRSGMPVYIESTKANFLLPIDLPSLNNLIDSLQGELHNTIEIVIYDNSKMELGLSGTWVSSNSESQEGVFLASYNECTEIALINLLREYNNYLKRLLTNH